MAEKAPMLAEIFWQPTSNGHQVDFGVTTSLPVVIDRHQRCQPVLARHDNYVRNTPKRASERQKRPAWTADPIGRIRPDN
jgi:hypothetical protein